MNKRSKLIILILDDNMIFTERMADMLAELNCIQYINIAADFTEACAMIKDEMPDLVLLDINLPGKNGIEFLKHLRKENKSCSVIVVSNHTDQHYKELCSENGAEIFLDKSNDFEKVPGLVASMYSLN